MPPLQQFGRQSKGVVEAANIRGAVKRNSHISIGEAKVPTTLVGFVGVGGWVGPPAFIILGSGTATNPLALAKQLCPTAAFIMNPNSSCNNMEIMVPLLDHMALMIPGGVSRDKPFLWLADGHGSRLSDDVIAKARSQGQDIALFPGAWRGRYVRYDVRTAPTACDSGWCSHAQLRGARGCCDAPHQPLPLPLSHTPIDGPCLIPGRRRQDVRVPTSV